MRRAFDLALLGATCAALACAPATTYVPTGFLVPMFSGPGQLHTSVLGGPEGAQLNAAYALAPHLALRLTGHTQSRDDGRYNLVSAGGGWFTGYDPRVAWVPALRGSVAVDLGVAEVRGASVRAVNGPPQGRLYHGFGYRAGFQGDLGLATQWVELAGVVRLVYFSLRHGTDSAPEVAGSTAEAWSFEPGLVLRVGPEALRLELQLGGAERLAESGVVGAHQRSWWAIGLAGTLD